MKNVKKTLALRKVKIANANALKIIGGTLSNSIHAESESLGTGNTTSETITLISIEKTYCNDVTCYN